MSLQEFKTFTADRMSVDQLIALLAFGKSFRAEYETLQLEVPEYVDLQIKSLRREIQARVADSLEKRSREIKLRLDSLKTPEQKKADLKRELKQIEDQLAAV